jgi:hypothetical protein
MFGIFKKKSKVELLQMKYEKLMAEAYKLSTINRSESDKKIGEADLILQEIEALQKKVD